MAAVLADAKQRALTINAATQVDTERALRTYSFGYLKANKFLLHSNMNKICVEVLQGWQHSVMQSVRAWQHAWANSGRIVLDKPGLEGYGVEVTGSTEEERLQVTVLP